MTLHRSLAATTRVARVAACTLAHAAARVYARRVVWRGEALELAVGGAVTVISGAPPLLTSLALVLLCATLPVAAALPSASGVHGV